MHILVYRLSSLGDVVLTVPVLKILLKNNPELKITFVTQSQYCTFFNNINRLTPVGVRLWEYKNFFSLFSLFRQLNNLQKFDYIVDLHQVLRTYVLNFFFRISGKKVLKFDKRRNDKKVIIETKTGKVSHTVQRYIEAFAKTGLKVGDLYYPSLIPSKEAEEHISDFFAMIFTKGEKFIGLAPFAKHDTKIWGFEKTMELIQLINNRHKVRFFVFGGGETEIAQIEEMKKVLPNIICVAGIFPFKNEIALLRRLDFLITMDSANMHIGCLSGTKVVSVWGATHPDLGFAPLGGNDKFIIQLSKEDVPCRPCSVFGDRPCTQASKICMEKISAKKVFDSLSDFGLI